MTDRPNPLCMVGAGYVGLVTAACLADAGVDVRLLDIDAARLALLRRGSSPIHEPLLDELLAEVIADGRLELHEDPSTAMAGAQIIMLAVGTPPLGDGRADLTQVRAALSQAVTHAGPETVIVIKSTVPPGTTESLRSLCRRNGRVVPLTVCPEFLAEGSAVRDFRQPPQVVIGGDDRDACERVARLFGHLDAPIRITDSTSAELIKLVVTEWPEYVNLDWSRVAALVRRQLVIDGRNCLLADPLVDLGFTYIGVGRPTRKPRTAKTPQSGGKRAPVLLAVK